MNLTKGHIDGAVKVGVARLGPVDDGAEELYARWIGEGKHGDMAYLERYADARHDPRSLLDGARSIIVAAFSYFHELRDEDMPAGDKRLKWARYALGRDYHEVIRERLARVAEEITASTGAACRVAVDTAPLRERYWAVKSGVGFIGVNNQLIVPGAGSWCVLGEIITTLDLEPDEPCVDSCLMCMKCVCACPGKALDGRGGMDARRCLSYLTIEKRISSEEDDSTAVVRGCDGSPLSLGNWVYGCDICQEVCPHNAGVIPQGLEEFTPRSGILALTREDIAGMSQEEFSRLFSHSAIKRTKLAGLKRNGRSSGED